MNDNGWRTFRNGLISITLVRFGELKSLEPRQRNVILRKATLLSHREPAVIALFGTFLSLIVALALLSPAWLDGWLLMAALFALLAPLRLYVHVRTRHHVRQLLQAIPTSM